MMITLAITYDPTTGSLKVDGAVPDRVAMLGMLELAKVALMQPETPASPIVRVPPGLSLSK